MFESIMNLFKKLNKKEKKATVNSKEAAKERLHLVLMQDRANVSADFLELMKQEIIDVIKKYIDVDEGAIDVRLTNKENEDGTNGAPALYANIPIINIKHETKKVEKSADSANNYMSTLTALFCLYYVKIILKLLSCNFLISFEINCNCFVFNFFWKCPIVILVCLKPVSCKLLIK